MIHRDFRVVMMENKNGYANLVTDIFLKIRCLPGHQANSLKLDPILDVFLDQLYPIDLMLIS